MICFLQRLTWKWRAQKYSWIVKLQTKIWRETVSWFDLDGHFISSSIFVYGADQVLILSSWQLPSLWKVSYSSLSQAVMSNLVWLECQTLQKNTRIMKLASCCFFGNLAFFFFSFGPPVVGREHMIRQVFLGRCQLQHLNRYLLCICSLQSILKKTVTVTETPSAVFHYSAAQDSCNSKHIDAIVEAAKKDFSTLMKLDVSYCRKKSLYFCF